MSKMIVSKIVFDHGEKYICKLRKDKLLKLITALMKGDIHKYGYKAKELIKYRVVIIDKLLEMLTDILQEDIYKHDYKVEEFNDYFVIIIDNNEDKVVAVNLNDNLLLEVKSGGWLNKMRLLGC